MREPSVAPDHEAVVLIFVHTEISDTGQRDAVRLFGCVDLSTPALRGCADSDCPGKSQHSKQAYCPDHHPHPLEVRDPQLPGCARSSLKDSDDSSIAAMQHTLCIATLRGSGASINFQNLGKDFNSLLGCAAIWQRYHNKLSRPGPAG
jgi:hypothetical protein